MKADAGRLAERHKVSRDVVEAMLRLYGKEDAQKALEAMSTPPPEYSVRVNTLKAEPKAVAERVREMGFECEVHGSLPEALLIRARGPNEVPEHGRRVTVDKRTGESVLLGAHVFAPGVKRCERVSRGDGVNVVDEHGCVLAAGVARMSCAEIFSLRRGLAVEVTDVKYRFPSFRDGELFSGGLVYPQSIPAMLTAVVLEPRPGELIVDLNCAPGGKLSHVCQLTGNRSVVVGVDRNAKKLAATLENLHRLGCSGFRLFNEDSRFFDLNHPDIEADRCLVDPPCSALGVVPKLFHKLGLADIESLAAYQKQFLRVAARVTKPGGVVVYSVCTVTPQECEGVAAFAVGECGLTLEEQPLYLGDRGLEAVLSGARLAQRFHPHRHGAGYFIARFRKSGGCP